MAPSPRLLAWMKELDGVDRINFAAYGMSSLFHLRSINIELDLLHGAASHWDPICHVFRFGSQELCPTVEEFQVLLGGRNHPLPAFPTPRQSAAKALSKLLGLAYQDAKELVKNNELNIRAIIRRFQPEGNCLNNTYQEQRLGALCLCLLAELLLIPADGRVRTELADIAVQIKRGLAFVPTVLAETILGLDGVYHDPSATFAGSPLLLQMWLMDKVMLLDRPSTPLHDPRSFANRLFFRIASCEQRWEEWFRSLQEDDINWRCEWYDLPAMTVSSLNCKRVALAGLESFTFYIPALFPRQLGNLHDVPPPEEDNVFKPVFQMSTLRQYQLSWPSRKTLQPTTDTRLGA